jgi:2-polyprenyl-3-methyl-5-hydroxy-6-metoxy-1,4-benzoquinol methylase
MDSKSKTPVGAYYEEHHITGHRLRQSFMEDVRKQLFSDWIGSGKEVLDLGGRDGSLTRHFLDGNRVTLADIDCAALAYAKENYAIKTVEVNLNEQLPFDRNSYDVVVMAEVLEHLPYPKFTLSEVQRILRTGGAFIGSIPLAYHLKDRWQVLRGKKLLMAGDPTHLQFFKYDELVSLLSGFFRVEDVRVLKGGKKAERRPQLFARDVAFRGFKV